MKKNKILVAFLIFFLTSFSGSVMAQKDDDDENDSTEVGKGWVPGYIVMEGQKDTLRGYLKIYKKEFGYVKRITFKKDNDGEILKFGGTALNSKYKEALRYFGTEGTRYRFINWVDPNIKTTILKEKKRIKDWVKLEEEGAINISLGFYERLEALGYDGSTVVSIPVYCLKKGTQPLAFIYSQGRAYRGSELKDYKIDDTNKKYFMSFIADDKELAKEVNGRKEVSFYEVLNYVKRYNSSASKLE